MKNDIFIGSALVVGILLAWSFMYHRDSEPLTGHLSVGSSYADSSTESGWQYYGSSTASGSIMISPNNDWEIILPENSTDTLFSIRIDGRHILGIYCDGSVSIYGKKVGRFNASDTASLPMFPYSNCHP